MPGDDAVLVLEDDHDFGDTYVEVRAWWVPASDRFPDGVRYSMQYGRTDGETILRYDNFPDHPGASHHHRHTPEGVEDVDFPGLEPLYDRFRREVTEHGEHWD